LHLQLAEVDEEVVAVAGDALLPRDEAEPFAEFEQELLQVVDDGLLEIALVPVGAVGQAEEFEDERILHDVLRGDDFLAAMREREDVVLVAAGGAALVQVGGDLAFEFAGGFDLVEGAGGRCQFCPHCGQNFLTTVFFCAVFQTRCRQMIRIREIELSYSPEVTDAVAATKAFRHALREHCYELYSVIRSPPSNVGTVGWG
jgi:hypothetical protein